MTSVAASRPEGGSFKSAHPKRFGEDMAAILTRRPQAGALFPYLRSVRPRDGATEFRQRCAGLKIEGVTLHSYRYNRLGIVPEGLLGERSGLKNR